jgi:hypothetical protein
VARDVIPKRDVPVGHPAGSDVVHEVVDTDATAGERLGDPDPGDVAPLVRPVGRPLDRPGGDELDGRALLEGELRRGKPIRRDGHWRRVSRPGEPPAKADPQGTGCQTASSWNASSLAGGDGG